MRIIRFRGLDAATKEWVYGNYCKAELLNESGFEHFIIEQPVNGSTHRIIPETVGQFIGLRDKDGVEAYEGDITEDDRGRQWVIYWAPGGFGTCRTYEFLKHPTMQLHEELGSLQNASWFMQNHKIIGNIHQNRYLLER